MIERRLGSKGLEALRGEFSKTGIEHLYDRFQTLEESLRIERKGYMEEIERVEDELELKQKILGDVQKLHHPLKRLREEFCRGLLDLKTDIVALSDNVKTQQVNGKNIIANSRSIVDEQCELTSTGHVLYQSAERGQKAIMGFGKIKDMIKKLSPSMEESRYKLQRSVEQALILGKAHDGESEKFAQRVDVIEEELKAFDTHFEQLLKATRTLEVVLSKMSLLAEEDELTNGRRKLQRGESYMQAIFRELDGLIANDKNITSKMEGHEEKVISDLKQMYQAVVQMGRVQKGLEKILTTFREPSEARRPTSPLKTL